jgi:ribosome-binding factor A
MKHPAFGRDSVHHAKGGINQNFMSHRIEQINSLIQQKLGEILAREVEFPASVLVTITRVDTAADFSAAKIYLSVLPFSESKKIIGFIVNRRKRLQHELAHKIRIRTIPDLIFVNDDTEEKASVIEKLIDEVTRM